MDKIQIVKNKNSMWVNWVDDPEGFMFEPGRHLGTAARGEP